MIMSTCESGDQYGVNYNFDYVLLQIRDTSDDFDEARIKLTLKDVDAVIEALSHFKNRVTRWKDAVGPQKDEESEVEYMTRVIQTARDNNYFIGQQEE